MLAVALAAAVAPALACTRAVYLGDNGDVITARSMDWKVDVATNLYILPRGIARTGQAGPKSLAWTARYGSVVATGYDVSTTDGMNERAWWPTCCGWSNRSIRSSVATSRAWRSRCGRSMCWTTSRPWTRRWRR
jgi:hypothetical protein